MPTPLENVVLEDGKCYVGEDNFCMVMGRGRYEELGYLRAIFCASSDPSGNKIMTPKKEIYDKATAANVSKYNVARKGTDGIFRDVTGVYDSCFDISDPSILYSKNKSGNLRINRQTWLPVFKEMKNQITILPFK